MVNWKIRATMEEIDLSRSYEGHPTVFSMRLFHGGRFTQFPRRKYVDGKQTYVDLLDMDTFSVHDIDDMMVDLGHLEEGIPLYYHYKRPLSDLDFGLFALGCDEDVRSLGAYVAQHKLIEVYIEHRETVLHTYRMSPNQPRIRIQEINDRPSSARRLLLGWHENNLASTSSNDIVTSVEQPVIVETVNTNEPIEKDTVTDDSEKGVHMDDEHGYEGGQRVSEEKEDSMDESENNEGDNQSHSDADDSDFIMDEENIVEDVDVNMKDFHANIDMDAEWIGGTKKKVVEEESRESSIEIKVLDNETLDSDSSSDGGPASQRRKSIKVLQRAKENPEAVVSEPFYIHQKFGSGKEFKDYVNLHSIETRREIVFKKNDKNRVRAMCNGSIPALGCIDSGGSSKMGCKEKVGKEKVGIKCPWVVYASKWGKDINWTVKTYNKEHRCLTTRELKACTYKFLAFRIGVQVQSNPTIPIRALRDQLQRELKADLSDMKVFRAKAAALNNMRGDYAGQYALLRDYVQELQTRNPNTTVKIDVESELNYNSSTRIFKRIYICLGALKKGFIAGKRELLGLDGAFIKGPYPGQLLTAIDIRVKWMVYCLQGLDGNNGTYPLAYALVETENKASWIWFLECLGDDLDFHRNSNFAFVSDRQKGLLQAIAGLFPCAEHRFCVCHIHENFRKRWKSKQFKDLLWGCVTATTVQHLDHAMDEVKKVNNEAYEWLKNIPPQHWCRSHFSGRAHSDVLLINMCEAFNSKLLDARDTPIITCLEYIREYLMRKIVNVQRVIGKSTGPLTPTASIWLEKLKEKANDLRVVFCGNGKYQVSGSSLDQYVVDMRKRSCSCNRWELAGILCKHAIASIWEMRRNKEDVGIPEAWVHPTYWLKTWEKMYSFTVDPINGRNMWVKSNCPTTLLPPKHHVPIGRPKKKRKKSVVELEDLVRGNTASRSNKSVTCSKCNKIGHNSRSCKGQGSGQPESQPASQPQTKSTSVGRASKGKGKTHA